MFARFCEIVLKRTMLAQRLHGRLSKISRAEMTCLRKLRDDELRFAKMLCRRGVPYLEAHVHELLVRMSETRLIYGNGTLIGSLAYYSYAGFLGMPLKMDRSMVHDIDVIIDPKAAGKGLKPVDIAYILGCDEDELEIPRKIPTSFQTVEGIIIDFLSTSQGMSRKAIPLPGVRRAGACPIRFHYDYLVACPVRTVLLSERGGIAVQVPAPARYALHKLVSAADRSPEKVAGSRKDLRHAAELSVLLASRDPKQLRRAWRACCQHGGKWAGLLYKAALRLPEKARTALKTAVHV